MAQTYIADVPDGTTNILQDNINGRNNENTLRSNFSGTTFPDTPVAGQHCYRTDTGIEYIYDGTAWVEVAATNTLGLDVDEAKGALSNLSSRLNVSINPDGTLKDPTTANVDEFKVSNLTPTYVDATTFSVPDDLTGIFTAGRVLKITDGAEVKYLSVVSSAFDTVTNVVIDGTITASITAVDYSLAQYGLPLASETVKGVVKVGSNISVADGVISVPEATETVKGVVELATSAEVLAGEDDERAVTPAGFKAGLEAALASPAMTGSATLNGTTDNTVQLTGIVTTLGLEVGDVIRIQYSGYDKLHTVESITDDNSIIVNYEHAGNRGNGSLKLADETATVTITRIAKWYNVPIGLGQGWVDVAASRSGDTTYTNTTGRATMVSVSRSSSGLTGFTLNGVSIIKGPHYDANVHIIVPNNNTYHCSGSFESWVELR